MAQEKNTIFISFSSKDLGNEYVNAVETAIYNVGGYEADHMNKGVIDARVTQGELDERIRRSRLVIMVLDQQYKDCENLRREYEKVTKRGSKIKVLIFIKKYRTPEEEQEQKENIFSVLNIDENRYNRFENQDDLQEKVENQLNRWVREGVAKRKILDKALKSMLGILAVAVLAVCVWWVVHYVKPYLEEFFKKNDDTTIVEPVPPREPPHEPEPVSPREPEPVSPREPEPVSPRETKPVPPHESEPMPSVVVVPNTFAVVCDDELFSAGISDAVSQVLPTLSQSADTSKTQWTISVKQYTVQEIPKIIDSDPLQVEVYYTVDIINNANNKKNKRDIEKRGRSIIQNRDDAIRNANEEVTKDIANILKSIQQ